MNLLQSWIAEAESEFLSDSVERVCHAVGGCFSKDFFVCFGQFEYVDHQFIRNFVQSRVATFSG